MIHVRFLNHAPDSESAARLSRLLTGTDTEADRAALLPVDARLPGGGRDPRTMPGWRPGFRAIGQGGGQTVTAGATS